MGYPCNTYKCAFVKKHTEHILTIRAFPMEYAEHYSSQIMPNKHQKLLPMD